MLSHNVGRTKDLTPTNERPRPMPRIRLLLLLLLLSITAVAGTVWAVDLVDSAHDLSTTSANGGIKADATDGTDQLCVFCHTPHSAVASTYGPLWNRNYTPSTFTYYASATFDGGTISLGPQSYACMTCHDGSLALDNLVNTPGSGTETWSTGGIYTFVDPNAYLDSDNKLASGPAALGTDLSDDHPVGFAYATSAAADANILATPAGNEVLYSGQVECATCHDVHDEDGGGAGVDAGYELFLRGSMDQSDLCLDCHDK